MHVEGDIKNRRHKHHCVTFIFAFCGSLYRIYDNQIPHTLLKLISLLFVWCVRSLMSLPQNNVQAICSTVCKVSLVKRNPHNAEAGYYVSPVSCLLFVGRCTQGIYIPARSSSWHANLPCPNNKRAIKPYSWHPRTRWGNPITLSLQRNSHWCTMNYSMWTARAVTQALTSLKMQLQLNLVESIV